MTTIPPLRTYDPETFGRVGLVIGGEVVSLASIVFLGKEGFLAIKSKVFGAVKGGFVAQVGRTRHAVGIVEQAVPTSEVQRVGEGINMTFASGLMFEINSATIQDSYKDDLRAAAEVFSKYADTNILVEGHTDDSGTDELNMNLSRQRADNVAAFLASNGVDRSRLQTKAFGETQPKFPNDSEANRSKNRRVELAVYANDDMVASAEAGTL